MNYKEREREMEKELRDFKRPTNCNVQVLI